MLRNNQHDKLHAALRRPEQPIMQNHDRSREDRYASQARLRLLSYHCILTIQGKLFGAFAKLLLLRILQTVFYLLIQAPLLQLIDHDVRCSFIAFQESLHARKRQRQSMIRDSILREIVCPDLLASILTAHLRTPLCSIGSFFLGELYG